MPIELVSDNGQPFSSDEFVNFCVSNGIKVTKTPPYHSPSNGLAEKSVQIVKQKLKKMVYDFEKQNKSIDLDLILDNILFIHRNTPNTINNKSPAETILKFIPKTRLSGIKPEFMFKKEVKIAENCRTEFKTNEKVWVKVSKENKVFWKRGEI